MNSSAHSEELGADEHCLQKVELYHLADPQPTHAHGVAGMSGLFMATGRCPSCGGDYITRLQAMHHIDFGTRRCRGAMLASNDLPGLSNLGIASAKAQRGLG